MSTLVSVPVGVRGVPFVGSVCYSGRSASELRDAMSGVAVAHDVEPLKGHLDGLATGFTVGDVHLAFVRYGGPTRVVADGTGSLVCWTIPQGAMDVGFGKAAPHRCTVGFVLSRETATTMLPHPSQGAVVITTTEGRLSQHLAKLSGLPQQRPIHVRPGHADHGQGRLVDHAWRQAAQALSTIPAPPRPLVSSLEETLLTALLLTLPSDATHLLADADDERRDDAGAEHVRRAIDWAVQHMDGPVTVTQWAADIGLSPRHLQKAFSRRHGCSPMQYLLLLRLQRARELLRLGTPGATVTGVAYQVGFIHLGRFAAAYRAQYGISPSQELAQATA